jgi:hypothetical protein
MPVTTTSDRRPSPMTLHAKTLSLPRLRKDVASLDQILTRAEIDSAGWACIKSVRDDFQAEIDFRVSLQDVDAFLNTSPHRHR